MTDADGTWRIAAAGVERVVRVADAVASTVRLGSPGAMLAVDGVELRVILDAARWRHDIPTWRWLESDRPDAAWMAPGFDDARWRVVPHLHPVIEARAAAPSHLRAWVTVPAAERGQAVTFLLGGLDGQDWTHYEAWLDGAPLDRWSASGSFREPRHITLAPDDPRLRHDVPMLLAVRVEGLERSHPDLVPGEREHHFFADWLLDQAVLTGSPDRVVERFRVVGAAAGGERELTLDLVADDLPGLAARLRYEADGGVIRKRVELRNGTDAPLPILDVVVDAWSGDLAPAFGGRGQPALLEADGAGVFAGVEHPAGVSRVAPGRVELVAMPGITLAPGAAWEAPPTVVGGAGRADGAGPGGGPGDPGGALDAAFRRYIVGLRGRPERRLAVYSALGWYDFTNPADPLPELTQELLDENLGQLAEVAEAGFRPDVVMLDDWWDWTDLGRFRPSAFPAGAAGARASIEAAGMRVGLWWASSRAAWSVRDRAGMEGAVANVPDFGAPVELAGGAWRWLEEFTNLMIGERRFCLAADPYRAHYASALPSVVREVDAGLLKMDCAVLHCTSSDHGHRAGRHSVVAMVDALEALVAACRAAAPDLRVVLYWGFRSPWFLGWADALFDKGLLMEAATVSSAPGRTVRQGLTTNVDQSIRHARFLPRRLQESLGVWVGDVAWCNRIGVAEWREAYLVDVARGADLVQLWGDLTLFDDADRRFLADVHDWLGAPLATREPVLLGGDPWRMEAYGYADVAPDRVIVTAIAPGPFEGTVRLPDGLLDGLGSDRAAWEAYPFPGAADAEIASGGLLVPPFGVRVVEITPALPTGERSAAPRNAPAIRPTRRLDGWVVPVLERGAGASGPVHWSGVLPLPAIGRGDEIHLVHRLERDGQWHYHPEPHAIVRADIRLDGLAVHGETMPRVRDRNGPGSPWVLRRIPGGPAWSGRELELALESDAPVDVRVITSATLVDGWWRHRRRFAPRPGS